MLRSILTGELDFKIPFCGILPKLYIGIAKTTETTRYRGKLNALIMGRKTWEARYPFVNKAQNRINIIISRVLDRQRRDIIVVRDLAEAVAVVENASIFETGFIFGGASIFQSALNSATASEILISEIKGQCPSDRFFPKIPSSYVEAKAANYGTQKIYRKSC